MIKVLIGCVILVPFAFVLNVIVLGWFYDISPWEVVADGMSRYQPSGSADGIAPAFLQSSPLSCGAAAITYLLTLHGDYVFEEDFYELYPDAQGGMLSFFQLKQFVSARGFGVQAFKGGEEDLEMKDGSPLLLHLRKSHYVVALHQSDDGVVLFDPAYGKTLTVPSGELLSEWSGNYLKLRSCANPAPGCQ